MTSPRDPKDQNNLIFAVALSILVLMGWQYFFARPELQHEQARQEFNKKIDAQNKQATPDNPPNVASTPIAPPSTDTPTGAHPPAAAVVSREVALQSSPRLKIETPSLDGSIDLKGGRIDDLVLTKYRETVDPNSPKVVLLSPSGSPEPYFAEYGWVPQSGSAIKGVIIATSMASHANTKSAGRLIAIRSSRRATMSPNDG